MLHTLETMNRVGIILVLLIVPDGLGGGRVCTNMFDHHSMRQHGVLPLLYKTAPLNDGVH